MMNVHVHQQSLCFNCGMRQSFTKPFMYRVITNDVCDGCHAFDRVGCDQWRVCAHCAYEWADIALTNSTREDTRADLLL